MEQEERGEGVRTKGGIWKVLMAEER